MRFGGIERLYGKSAMEKFHRAHVCVVGIGGVGSWAVEALARSGIGKITMIDLDEICITNINRQLHAMDGEIGRQKTAAMASRINAIHPECEVVCLEAFFSKRNADEVLDQGFDFVIDAIDQVQSKALLLDGCHKRGIPVISCGGAGGLRDPSLIKTDDIARCHNDSLMNHVRTNLRKKYGYPAGPDPTIKRKLKLFGIDCIFSSERPVYQQCDGEVSEQRPKSQDGASNRIDCTSGFGSSTHMTATIGFFAVSRCLSVLSAGAR
ncbi:tRNA cyclic N6-threonylcarbamoyladenosine(37) synthase TcdA [Oceaniferula spumae]|uniref:tRNA cyclic N6-threonylcarbamoyladenosine(37) synthase TcdA n=1 Tax=Oceaniferula spumae TaxID=2979115 RepID=A0AAT9FQZ2_9BACT